MTRTQRVAAWLAEHPTARRATTVLLAVHILVLWSVLTAPSAAAATAAAALGWTGLKDSDGVPLGDYFLSVVDTSEAVANNGRGVSVLDPSSMLGWVTQAAETAATHSTVAWWLTDEAAVFIFLIGISLWFLRFTLSSSWLVGLAQIGWPIYSAVNTLVNQMWLGPLAVTVCVCVGGWHMMRGRRGRGSAVIGSGALLFVLLITVFRDPITDLFSDHGLLAIGRATGFQIAEATRNGSYAPGQSLHAQLDALLSQLITAAVRQPLQVFNFGTVVDSIGGCRASWSAAVMAAGGQGPGPAHAMAGCGAPQALAHAQHLGANDFTLGLFFLLIAVLIGLFLWYIGITVLLVGLKALFFGVVVGPAFLVGIAGLSRAAAYAKHCGWQLFSHAVQMIAFTAYLGVTAMAMSWVGSTRMLGAGSLTVVPRMLLLGLAAVAAALLFRFIDRSFHTDGIGTIAHQVRSAAHAGAATAHGHYEQQREHLDHIRGLTRRFGQWRRPTTPDDDNDDDSHHNSPDASTPEFPTVTSRATRTPAAARGKTATAGRGAVSAEALGTEAAADTAAATDAEAGAAIAAPEVVIPAAAAATAAKHIKHQHESSRPAIQSSAAQAQQRTPVDSRPAAARQEPGHDTLATRAASPLAAGDRSTSHVSTPPAGPTVDEPPSDFPTSPPKQRPRGSGMPPETT